MLTGIAHNFCHFLPFTSFFQFCRYFSEFFCLFLTNFFFIFSALNQQPVPGGTGCWLFNLYFELCGTCGGSFLIWTAKGLGLFVREELSLELLQIGLRLFYFFFF